MATLGERISDRDRQLFVGRDAELVVVDAALAGTSDVRILHVVGPAGIGKSALLREMARRAAAQGFAVVWIDGRDMAPFPGVLELALDPVSASQPTLLVFDSFETMMSLDSRLRETVIPALPDTTVIALASRVAPSREWFEHGWDAVVHLIELHGLTPEHAKELGRRHGVVDHELDGLVRRSLGSPLTVVVGAHTSPSDDAAQLEHRLIGDEVDAAHQRIMTVASLARVTTPQLLADVLDSDDPDADYAWLATRTFSEALATGVTLHAVVADAVRARSRQRDPVGEATTRQAIADHLYARALDGERNISLELQHLVVDPHVRWGYANDVGSRYRIDDVAPGDAEAVGAILTSVGASAWWEITRRFFEDHEEHVGVARDHTGAVGGYFIAVTPSWAPAAAEDDPVLGPWLQYARTALETDDAVLWREAVDLTGEMGEITSLLGAGGLVASGLMNPRYAFLPISPAVPAARLFSESLDGRHIAALDVDTHGMSLECHLVDYGPSGLLGYQRDWIYRESGAAVPAEPQTDPARVLRWLRDPAGLEVGPPWLGESPAERLATLRRLVEAALDVFGTSDDEQLARRLISAAFLGDGASHEAIAHRLHLSRSAYFRRLQVASRRVGSQVLALAKS